MLRSGGYCGWARKKLCESVERVLVDDRKGLLRIMVESVEYTQKVWGTVVVRRKAGAESQDWFRLFL